MSNRRWWYWCNPRNLLALWRYRHSAAYLTAMQGYWSGQVCRFCDHSYADRSNMGCDVPGRPCDFRTGK